MNAITLTPQQLRQAADLQEQILTLRVELEHVLGSTSSVPAAAPGRKRKLSAQGLANIRAGARKRWARERGANGEASRPAKSRGKMSAAGRKAIAAALRARWGRSEKSRTERALTMVRFPARVRHIPA
jgi:hypothetical protein